MLISGSQSVKSHHQEKSDMPLRERVAQQTIALVVGLIGLAILTRFAFGTEAIDIVLPQVGLMGPANAILFACCAVCLWKLPFAHTVGKADKHIVLFCSAMLVLYPVLFLIEYWTGVNLGVDIARPSSTPPAPGSYPGRLSPNACLGFIAAGCAFHLLAAGWRRGKSAWVAMFASVLTLVSVGGLVGYMLGLEQLYQVASFNRMLPATAASLALVAVGLWFARERWTPDTAVNDGTQEREIMSRSAFVLTFVALLAGVTGYWVVREAYEKSISDNLAFATKQDARAINAELHTARSLAITISQRPSVRIMLETPETGLARDAAFNRLQLGLRSFIDASGLQYVAVHDDRDAVIAESGQRHQAGLVVWTSSSPGLKTILSWHGGLHLESVVDIRSESGATGSLHVQQNLPTSEMILADFRSTGDSSDAVICGALGNRADCAPSRFNPKFFDFQIRDSNGALRLPMSRALAGNVGAGVTKDLRGIRVIAGHAPINEAGLGLVLKVDASTIYAPLRKSVNTLALILFATVGLGTFILRSHVRPLLRRKFLAEQELERARADFRMILDRMPAMISYWNADYTNRFANKAYAEQYGMSADQLVGMHVKDVLGPVVYDKSIAFINATLAGETQTFVRSAPNAAGVMQDHELTYLPESADSDGRGLIVLGMDITQRRLAEQALEQSERRFREIYTETPAMMCSLDAHLQITSVSSKWLEKFGYEDSEILGRSLRDFLSPESAEDAFLMQPSGFAGWESLVDVPYQWITKSGQLLETLVSAVARKDAQGATTGVLIVIDDVTLRLHAERALQASQQELLGKNELLRVTLNSIGDAVITTDAAGVVQWMNPIAESLTGWTSDEAFGRPIPMVFYIVDEETRRPAENPVERCLKTNGIVSLAERTLLIARDGREFGIEDSAAPIRDDAQRLLGSVLVFHDVSEQRRLSREMTHRARHDALTGLCNRLEFEQRVGRILAGGESPSKDNVLFFIDLDQFKLVNDSCGHAAGDQLLCQVSRLLQEAVRTRDTVARLGGDEFGVILEHCGVEQGEKIAQKICDQMEEFRFLHDGRRFRIGTSIGLVPLDSRWRDIQEVMQAADTSCYTAKEAGRNRVHVWFDTDIVRKHREGQTAWATRLDKALDEHRFVLYGQRIQPLNGVEHGVHLEVLLRLREEDGSIIGPASFLPAAERFHTVSRIDRWVVDTVFKWMTTQREAGTTLELISVNLSGHSVGDKAFHRFTVDAIAASGIDPHTLCFEITETAAITNIADATEFIRQMRSLGVKIALDDFGAGASSFGYLRALPVDFLKIDGQFVRSLEHNALDRAAVRCFQDVARVVGVKTIAEFVETESVKAILASMDIDYIQGHLVHEPEPLDAMVDAAHRRSVPSL